MPTHTIKTDQISYDFRNQEFQYNRNGHNVSMFLDDLSFSRYSIKDRSVKIEVTTPDEAFLVASINEKFPINDSWRNNLSESILNFFALISGELAHNGFCIFEKVCILNSSKFIALKLIKGKLTLKKEKIIQYVPNEKGNNSKKIIIPLDKCFKIEFPNDICTFKEYVKVLTKMREIDTKNPMFSILNPSELNKITEYNPLEHNKKLDLVLWNLTKKISWHHRSQFSRKELFTGYYLTLRDLKFKKTKLILMYHIFNFIEEIIEKVFDETKISINYIKKIEDIDELIENFKKGNFSQQDYLKAIGEYHS